MKKNNQYMNYNDIQLAKIQLKNIMADAAEILQKIENMDNMDSWIQNKLTITDDYLTDIKKYIQFGMEEEIKELPLIHLDKDIEMPSLASKLNNIKSNEDDDEDYDNEEEYDEDYDNEEEDDEDDDEDYNNEEEDDEDEDYDNEEDDEDDDEDDEF